MIEISNLYFRYPGAAPLLKNISTEFRSRELTLLLGANGAGKSTLLKLICSTLRPDEGCIRIQGKIYPSASAKLFRRIFYAPQNIADMCVGISPAMDMQAWQYAIPKTLDDNALRTMATRFGDLWDSPYYKLSQGEARQCALAILPWLHERYWLLDEPFTGLDDTAIVKVKDTLRQHLAAGQGALIVTHDPQQYQDFNPRYMELYEGALRDV